MKPRSVYLNLDSLAGTQWAFFDSTCCYACAFDTRQLLMSSFAPRTDPLGEPCLA